MFAFKLGKINDNTNTFDNLFNNKNNFMRGQYILVGKEPKPVTDLTEWEMSFGNQNRTVEQTQIGDVKVSTVFLGLDHAYGGGEPLLFETMIFGGKKDGWQDRYSTWDEAVKGHRVACDLVNSEIK